MIESNKIVTSTSAIQIPLLDVVDVNLDSSIHLHSNPLTSRVLRAVDSPGRSLPLARSVRKCWSHAQDKKLPETARSLASLSLKEQFYHLDKLLEKKVPLLKTKIFNHTLAEAWNLQEGEALEKLGKLIFLLDQPDIDFSAIDLDESFDKLFMEKKEALFCRLQALEESDPRWKRSQIEKEFSLALISDAGFVNLGLIPSLKLLFMRLEPEESAYSLNFVNALNSLEELSSTRKILASFEKPKGENHMGREIIRVSLELSRKHPIEAVDAIRTATKAYLSYPRQDHVSNCFAISLAIALLSSSKERCLNDFREILTYGYLKKDLEGHPVHFRALLKQPLDTVSLPLKSTAHDELKEDIRLKKLFSLLHKKLPRHINPGSSVDDLLATLGEENQERGRFIWESGTKNPLVTIWGNLLASMAEGRSDGLIKSALIGSAIFVAKEEKKPAEEIERLRQALIKRAYLYYDPSLESPLDPKDKGAFVLYDKGASNTRVDSPKKFQNFLSLCLENSDLGHWYKKPETLYRIMEVYHPEGRRCKKSMSHLKKLNFTPWVTRIGNDPREILRTYKETQGLEPTQKVAPKTPEELFECVCKFGKKFWAQKLNTPKSHSSILIPVRIIGQHTFNMILTHPSFTKCILEGPEKSLEEMRQVAEKIASSPVPPTTEQALSDYLLERYPSKKSQLASLSSKRTLRDYRNALITTYPPAVIDKKLLQFLPVKERLELGRFAIHFADTNWAGKGQDIHLAFCYHPATLQLTLCEIEEKGLVLKLANSRTTSKEEETWEFFPENVFSDSHPIL